MKLPTFLSFRALRQGSAYKNQKPYRRHIPNPCAILQDDIDNLKELFRGPTLDELPGWVKVNPSVKVIRRLRIVGLIDVGQYGEGAWVNFGQGKQTVEDMETANISMVARMTPLGKVAMSTATVDELVKKYNQEG
jgi:hypothetical protein